MNFNVKYPIFLIMTRPLLSPSLLLKILRIILILEIPLAFYCAHLKTTIIVEWSVLSFINFQAPSTWVFDPISLIFSSTVNLIALSVIKFSYEYIAGEKYLSRFIILIFLFVLSINILIFMPNLIILLIGWDGLGLVSFLLVIYYQNPRSLSAGIITVLTNRIGDAFIIIAIALTLTSGQWNSFNLWASPEAVSIAFLVILAATTKRAQIPFSTWLPAAMAAPTPVSALVHSSTLVTAGVYLLIRFHPLLLLSPHALNYLLIISATTTLIAGLAAIVENDIKKIIALSTLRQLGIIIMRLALAAPILTFFHLITHALFKALLFICAGSIIHSHNNNQDLRLFGSITKNSPFTALTIILANSALTGIPFIAGFYSKDLIIDLTSQFSFNLIILPLTLLSTILTAAYSLRFIYHVAWSPKNSNPTFLIQDKTIPHTSTAIILLSSGAILGGTILNWLIIFPLHSPVSPIFIKLIPLIITFAGILIATPLFLYIYIQLLPGRLLVNNFLSSMWFLRPASSFWPSIITSCRPLITIYHDHGWNEFVGPQGVASLLTKIRNLLLKWQYISFPAALIITTIFATLWLTL